MQHAAVQLTAGGGPGARLGEVGKAYVVLRPGRHGTADEVILTPQDPYTRELRAASPDPEKHFAAAASNGGAL